MSIPDRWLKCPRKGQIVAGKFLPFKTPLGPRYDPEIPEDRRFTVEMLISFMEAMECRMGLVVDLTKTDRFYDKGTLMDRHIGHYKLKCEGFGEAPTREQVNDFKQICSRYFAQHPGEIIGIHCTHGFNRTGFLIVAYLVEAEDWSLEAAVDTFAKARPPGMYKEHYLTELAARYNEGNMADIVAPERPAWCFEEGEEQVGVEGEGKGKGPKGKRKGRIRMEMQNEAAKFMDGVQGVVMVGSPKREEIQQACQDVLQWHGGNFPGAQPVSMDTKNIELLHKKPYRVSWKADGTRYMMYIKSRGEVYMLDRDNAVFPVPHLSFPDRKNPEGFIRDTLIDGELVLDKVEGKVRPRYLMYDILQFQGSTDVAKCDHPRRLLCLQRELVQPRDDATKQGTLDRSREPFSIRVKQFWDVSEAKFVLEKFIPKVTHETDGLILTPAQDPYQPGPCPDLLKWKPPELNTVDFKLNIVKEVRKGMLPEKVGHLYVSGLPQPFSAINFKANKEAFHHNGRIVECYWDKRKGWTFLRVRDDKSFPNSYTTAVSVCQSIAEPVTKQKLLEDIEKKRWQPTSVAGVKRPQDGTPSQLMPPPKVALRSSS